MVRPEVVQGNSDHLQLLYKLWVHEARRVFSDRLVSSADQELVEGLLAGVFED